MEQDKLLLLNICWVHCRSD